MLRSIGEQSGGSVFTARRDGRRAVTAVAQLSNSRVWDKVPASGN